MPAPVAPEQCGATLVEMVIAIVVIAVTLTALTASWSYSIQHSADVMWQARSAYIGQAYLEEILAQRFDEQPGSSGQCGAGLTACTAAADLGPEAGESRTGFDDVDDYHGLTEQAMALPAAALGQANPYAGYTVQVTVAYANAAEDGFAGADMLKRITVRVTPPGLTSGFPFTAYRGNF